MTHRRLTVAIAPGLARFLDEYRNRHSLVRKSSVVEQALELLRDRELELAYAAASLDVDDAWETTSADGLSD